MLFLMSELFEKLPERGDAEKPEMVFFFDEAHLLFSDAPKVLVQKIEQVVKLIRSKGVGIYFISQSPSDIPDSVLAQLSNRVQHALRAYTPSEQKAVKTAAQTFRANPAFDTQTAIMELGVGEALVSCLDENGVPGIVQRAFILPPQSRMGTITDEERRAVIDASDMKHKYDKAIDNFSAYEYFEQQIRELQSGLQETNAVRERFSGEISRLEERKISVQNDYDGVIRQLLEQYELSLSEAQAQAQPLEDLQTAQRELQSLKAQIRGLGTVNVAAIEEYAEVSKRYQFLSEQMQDAETAKRELEDLITSLTEEMQRIFSESFSVIDRNFQEIFKDLFGGGEARLELTDPEHVLESGIEIKVAPPGKVIKNLISLSGGEQSFVAIAIYFAILRLRPSPFCILDEIDAALDEGNVRRYAQYLQNFTDTTQFILVTHRRSAMEEASVLYGVTMQEDGISRLLRMEQEELEKTE